MTLVYTNGTRTRHELHTGNRRIFAVSDLHIGAAYSGWKREIALVKEGIRLSTDTVMCGDIFEGTQGHISVEKRIETTKRELEDMIKVARAHGTTIHILFGNHEVPLIKGGIPDGAPYAKVAIAMRELAHSHPDVVQLHEKGWVQLGDTVFTHGHLQTGFFEPVPSTIRNFFELPFNIALPGYAADKFIFPREKAHRNLHKAFAHEPELKGETVARIISGHRHAPTPVAGVSTEGLTLGTEDDLKFHDLGAAIITRPHLFRPLLLTQDSSGNTASILGKEHFAGEGHLR